MNNLFPKILLLIIVLIGVLSGCDSNKKPYEEAQMLYRIRNYTEAIVAFDALGDYKDSTEQAEKIRELVYTTSVRSYEQGNFSDAAEGFEGLGEYKDARELASKSRAIFPLTSETPSGSPFIDNDFIVTGYSIGTDNSNGNTTIRLYGSHLLGFGIGGWFPVVVCTIRIDEEVPERLSMTNTENGLMFVFDTSTPPTSISLYVQEPGIINSTISLLARFNVSDTPPTE